MGKTASPAQPGQGEPDQGRPGQGEPGRARESQGVAKATSRKGGGRMESRRRNTETPQKRGEGAEP
jgi:hypothetical protein